jgi:nitrate/nitrite transporter NarK
LVNPTASTLVPLLIAKNFGYKAFPQLIGIFNGVIGAIGIIAPVGIGMIAAATGAYTMAMWILIGSITVAYILGMMGLSRGKYLPQTNEKGNK